MKRFKDKGETYYSFFKSRIVCCPRCSKPVDLVDERISCVHCGYSKIFKSSNNPSFRILDTGLELKYFLELNCCGNTLYALNVDHLDFIKHYVESDLRERIPNINKGLASRLPQWIKDKKNRHEILSCVDKLYKLLADSKYRTNLRN